MAGWRLVPQVLLSETYSDNVERASAAAAEHDWITLLSPGVRLEGGGGRVQGFLDYRRNQYFYSRRSELDNGQNLLNSSATADLLEQWLFLDARARVVQVDSSPFGSTASETPGANPNRTETSVLQLSPYVRGAIADTALYQVRFNATESHASGNAVPDTGTREWVGRIRNAPAAGFLGWAVDGSRLAVRSSAIGEREHSRVRGSLLYAPHSDIRLALHDGVERSDLAGAQAERTTTPGFGVEWSPSGRTQAAGVFERRFFGTGRSVLATHRRPGTAFKYSEQKDISTLPGRLAAGGQSSIQALMSDLLTASVPDPAARSQAVREQLERTGAAEYSPASNGFLSSQASIAVQREASLALLGRRNTVTLVATRDEFNALGERGLGLVSATASAAVRRSGYSASWARRLSPLSSITLLDSRSRTRDLDTPVGSRQHSLSLSLLTTVGRRTSFSFGVRRLTFDSDLAADYVEHSVVTTLALRF